MKIDKKNASVNHQDHPHQEGQQNNTPSIHEFDGQCRRDNMNQPISNMGQEEEKAEKEKEGERERK